MPLEPLAEGAGGLLGPIRRLAWGGSRRRLSAVNLHIGLSAEEKKGYCDLIIDNSGSLEETRKQVERLWKKLKKIQIA